MSESSESFFPRNNRHQFKTEYIELKSAAFLYSQKKEMRSNGDPAKLFQGGHIPAKIKFPVFSLSFPCARKIFPVLFLCHK